KFDEFEEDIDELGEFDESEDIDDFVESDEKFKTIREFREADMMIPELSIALKECPDVIYTSKFINTHEISQRFEEKSDPAFNDLKIPDSMYVNIYNLFTAIDL
ncbi:6398_t:CDS:2, partial [Scutellospora calospora]